MRRFVGDWCREGIIQVWHRVAVAAPGDTGLDKDCTLVLNVRRGSFEEITFIYVSCSPLG
jgi:hypothetical protein